MQTTFERKKGKDVESKKEGGLPSRSGLGQSWT